MMKTILFLLIALSGTLSLAEEVKPATRAEFEANPLLVLQRSDTGDSHLMYAVRVSDVAYVEYLLQQAPSLLDLQDSYGRTALMMAEERHIAQLLLEAGADAAIKNDAGNTALDVALVTCDTMWKQLKAQEVASVLLDAAAPYTNPQPVLMYACRKGKSELVKNLLSRGGVDVNEPYLLQNAIFNCTEETVRLLLAAGALPCEGAVAAAEMRGWDALAKELKLRVETVPATRRHSNAFLSSFYLHRHVDESEKFGNLGSVPQVYDELTLTRDVDKTAESLMNCVRFMGGDENAEDAFMHAVQTDNVSRLRYMVENGVRIAPTGSRTYKCLCMAVIGKNPREMLSLLLKAGADINAVGTDGCTVLMGMVSKSLFTTKNALECVLDFGPDLEHTHEGKTPLLMAVETENFAVAYRLLCAGARADEELLQRIFFMLLRERPALACDMLNRFAISPTAAESATGLTPLDIATRSGNTELAKVLQEYAAKSTEH